jgi:predicted type IV restriction endonuclease
VVFITHNLHNLLTEPENVKREEDGRMSLSAPKEIAELVERFDRYQENYKSSQYNETQVRREFVDPFFKALGWDMDNIQGYAEAYKEVIHEDAIRVEESARAPDYCFRIGGVRKFFVETKKPSVNLKDDIVPAFQVRRYAWSAKLALSILTDFGVCCIRLPH